MADSQRWRNYGDVSFLEHGGCMVREKERGMYEVISLFPCIPDYEGDVEDPCIVAKCTVCDIGDYANDLKVRKEVNDIFGYPQDHIPVTADDLLMFAVNLVEMYGIWEFDPVFPEETGLGPYSYGAPASKQIVSKALGPRIHQTIDRKPKHLI